MTDATEAIGAGGAAPANEMELARGAPKVKARAERNVFMSLLPMVLVLAVAAVVALGGWFAWKMHRESQEANAENAGNVASKTSIGKRRGGDVESARRLGVDGEDPASAPARPVPAIAQDNAAAQPIPVVQQGKPGSAPAPEPPPRSRYDAPMRFGPGMSMSDAAIGPGGQPFARTAAPTGMPAGITRAGSGTRPDYSVPVADATPFPAAAPPAPKGSLNLQTLRTEKAEASLIGNRNFILAKGASMDCNLDTAMRSNQPGMVRCSLTKDVWSDNSAVLLAERGSTLTGEYAADVRQGQAEIQVIWNRIKTTHGVVVDLASPATDALGRAGVDGQVDNHWGQRFGAAVLLSIVKDAIGYATATRGTTQATGVVYGNTAQTSEGMAETILKQTINIPPTITRAQGTRLKVFVARDLDFSKVYELQLRSAHVE